MYFNYLFIPPSLPLLSLSLSLSLPLLSLSLSLSRKQLMLQMAQMQKKFYSEHKNELDLIESEPKRKSSKYSICTHNNVHVSWVRLLFAAIVSVTCISPSLPSPSLSFILSLSLLFIICYYVYFLSSAQKDGEEAIPRSGPAVGVAPFLNRPDNKVPAKCILCQEEAQDVAMETDKRFVLATCVQRSTVLRRPGCQQSDDKSKIK